MKAVDVYGQTVDELNALESQCLNFGSLSCAPNVTLAEYLLMGGGILPDRLIRERVKINPFVEAVSNCVVSYGLGHYGYDIRVDSDFRVFKATHCVMIDPEQLDERAFDRVDANTQLDDKGRPYCVIPPHSFALAVSMEHFEIPREVIGLVVDKSTYRRCGISMGATIMEPCWAGKLTLEISNTTPLPAKIYAGQGIAQVIFIKGVRLCETSYADKKGRYQGQTGLTLPCAAQRQGLTPPGSAP